MSRILVGAVVSLVWSAPCTALTIPQRSLPDLVASSDAVVIGTVSEVKGCVCHVKVTRLLSGKVGREIQLLVRPYLLGPNPGALRVGDSRIFFLKVGIEWDPGSPRASEAFGLVRTSRKQVVGLSSQVGLAGEQRIDDVRRLLAMKASPKEFLDSPQHASWPPFLELLRELFADRSQVGRLHRRELIKHLEGRLSLDDPEAVIKVIDTLFRVRSKGSSARMVPLLRHSDRKVRRASAWFSGWAKSRETVRPLCDALDAGGDDHDLCEVIGDALGEIGDADAVPALKRAVKRGVRGPACLALGRLGDASCFDILLASTEKRGWMDAVDGLLHLVRRSNKKVEPWMEKARYSGRGVEHKRDWRKWWDANKTTFKVVKTARVADSPTR
jgi:hypothetical protein